MTQCSICPLRGCSWTVSNIDTSACQCFYSHAICSARTNLTSYILNSLSSQYLIILEVCLWQKASHTNKIAVSQVTAQLPSISSPFLDTKSDASSKIYAIGHNICHSLIHQSRFWGICGYSRRLFFFFWWESHVSISSDLTWIFHTAVLGIATVLTFSTAAQ